jgi:hypothetical protein
MKTFIATIEGTTPMLQNRFDETAEMADANSRKVHIRKEDPREVAERAAHRNADGHLFFPGAAIARLLREAGSAHKQRGSRKSLRYIIPAAILVQEEKIILRDSFGEPITDFEVDSRSVVIPSTKGRIMRHRPRLNSWACEFTLEIDDDTIDPVLAHQLLVEGGSKIGLGDFRPEKGGPFGRFHVVAWSELKAVKAEPKMKGVRVPA